MDRRAVAALPVWERELLLDAGRSLMGLDSQGSVVGSELGLSASELAVVAGG